MKVRKEENGGFYSNVGITVGTDLQALILSTHNSIKIIPDLCRTLKTSVI